jgi:hypothetical protein
MVNNIKIDAYVHSERDFNKSYFTRLKAIQNDRIKADLCIPFSSTSPSTRSVSLFSLVLIHTHNRHTLSVHSNACIILNTNTCMQTRTNTYTHTNRHTHTHTHTHTYIHTYVNIRARTRTHTLPDPQHFLIAISGSLLSSSFMEQTRRRQR